MMSSRRHRPVPNQPRGPINPHSLKFVSNWQVLDPQIWRQTDGRPSVDRDDWERSLFGVRGGSLALFTAWTDCPPVETYICQFLPPAQAEQYLITQIGRAWTDSAFKVRTSHTLLETSPIRTPVFPGRDGKKPKHTRDKKGLQQERAWLLSNSRTDQQYFFRIDVWHGAYSIFRGYMGLFGAEGYIEGILEGILEGGKQVSSIIAAGKTDQEYEGSYHVIIFPRETQNLGGLCSGEVRGELSDSSQRYCTALSRSALKLSTPFLASNSLSLPSSNPKILTPIISSPIFPLTIQQIIHPKISSFSNTAHPSRTPLPASLSRLPSISLKKATRISRSSLTCSCILTSDANNAISLVVSGSWLSTSQGSKYLGLMHKLPRSRVKLGCNFSPPPLPLNIPLNFSQTFGHSLKLCST